MSTAGEQGHRKPQSPVTGLRCSPPPRTKPGPEQTLQKQLLRDYRTLKTSDDKLSDKNRLVWGAWGRRPGQCLPYLAGCSVLLPGPEKAPPPRPISLLSPAEISAGCPAVPAPPTRLPHPPGGQCTKGHFSAELQLHLQPGGLRVGEGKGGCALRLICLHGGLLCTEPGGPQIQATA